MAKILHVKPNANKTKYYVYVEDNGTVTTYFISDATYLSLNSPMRGCEIDESALVDMRYEDEIYRAVKKACTLLSDHDMSEYEIKAKLNSKGFSRDAIDNAVSLCLERGYLDEERQLLRAVEREANDKLRGRYYIKRKLASKGYSVSAIDRAISVLVESGDVDFDENFEKLANKRGIETEEERLKLKYKFGYKY